VETPRNGRSALNGRALTSIRNNAKNMEDTAARKKEEIKRTILPFISLHFPYMCAILRSSLHATTFQ
jgi:hypothetical protein